MTFDLGQFLAAIIPSVLTVVGMLFAQSKAQSAPSAQQHETQAELARQSLALLGQVAGAAAQSIKVEPKAETAVVPELTATDLRKE